ncbi:DUF5597 domain-containing protein [Gaetbulibacter sp. M240]|uniref:GH35 family beta-galactosidase n=1 Tax=Gaetbulibacter sp. M240 TaxID=3126511 RepID=UPI00374E9062
MEAKRIRNIREYLLSSKLLTILLLFIASCNYSEDKSINPKGQSILSLPYIKETNGVKQLIVDGAPYVMLGGELLNSSASSIEYMDSVWSRLKGLHVNTVFLPINWQQFEPVEGKFDYTLIDEYIKRAHEHDLHLVVLWFGSWKNGRSHYTPDWVKMDVNRFPRMHLKDQKTSNTISNLNNECLIADKKAYVKLMERIKHVDKHHTVLMVQIENEVGLKGASRDFSPAAITLFEKQVPKELIEYINKNIDKLKPFIREAYQNNGSKRKGSWAEVFGESLLSDEIFMAWNYATYINQISAAGKVVHNIPTLVNAWAAKENQIPGDWPSGGPNYRMLDIWQAGAPNIDIFATDNYGEKFDIKSKAFIHHEEKFDAKCKAFKHQGNPLFIPEACAIWLKDTISAPAKAFYTIGHYNAICFSPFGIDHDVYHSNHPIKNAYKALDNLLPLIVVAQLENKVNAFMEIEDSSPSSFILGDFEFTPNYALNKAPHIKGFGLIIQISENEFIIAGNAFELKYKSTDKNKPYAQLLSVEEGSFVDGKWQKGKVFNGDEFGIKFPAKPFGLIENVVLDEIRIHKVKLFNHD